MAIWRGLMSESSEPVYELGSWGWLCELVGVDPDEDVDGSVSGA